MIYISFDKKITGIGSNPNNLLPGLNNDGTDDWQSIIRQTEVTKTHEQHQLSEPKTFIVTFDDKKLLPTKATEQPNGTYLLDNQYKTYVEAERVRNAIEKRFGHKGYKTTIESKSRQDNCRTFLRRIC